MKGWGRGAGGSIYGLHSIASGRTRLFKVAAQTRECQPMPLHIGRDSVPMPKVGTRGTKRLREKYQDSRVEDGVLGAGISHRMSLPYRSNSQARSFARRLELNPVTYRTLLISRVEEGLMMTSSRSVLNRVSDEIIVLERD